MKSEFLKAVAAVVVLIMLVSGLSACGSTPAPATVEQPITGAEVTTAPEATQAPQPTAAPAAEATQAPQPTAAPAAERKVATLIFTQEFDNLSPMYSAMWFSQVTLELWQCAAWLFDERAEPFPVLLAEIPSTSNGGISADGKAITLKLRPDTVWSDGTPLTSEDFKFTYDMVLDPGNTVATTYPYDQITSLETPDPQTVVMHFEEPFASWLSNSLWHGILPAHVLQPIFEQEGTLDQAEWNKKPTVGCGPFVFQEWESGSFARFVASDNYWLGKPKIDEIFIRFVPDDASQMAALLSGDGDLGSNFSHSDVPTLRDAGISVIYNNSGWSEGIYFTVGEKNHPALKELNVRKAIALATDRFSLCKDLLLGEAKTAASVWQDTKWMDPTLEPWPYDPEQAKELLDEAGWVDTNGDGVRDKDGVELVLKYGATTREIRKDTQAVLQQQLAEVGIGVELLSYDASLFFAGYQEGGPVAKGELDMFELSSSTDFPDPAAPAWLCSQVPSDENPDGSNWQQNCDPELERLFELQQTQVDPAERQETFFQISRLIYDKVYWLGLWRDLGIWGVSSRLQGVKMAGANSLFNVMEWDLTQ